MPDKPKLRNESLQKMYGDAQFELTRHRPNHTIIGQVLTALRDEVARQNKRIEALRQQISIKDESLHHKNLALDSMWYVWCDGGCSGKINSWKSAPEITEELVLEAERNTKRLRTYWENLK